MGMPERDYIILMGMGGLFVILGIVLILWGGKEEKGYYDAISARPDVREFLEHEPEVHQPKALKIGGWLAIAIGLLMIAMGGAFWVWG
jgi:hypothetical protein